MVTALDAVLIINALNASGVRNLPLLPGGTAAPLFFDVSGDDVINPLNALLVINYLNAGGDGEGEPHIPADEAAFVDSALGDDDDWSLWQSAAWDALVEPKRKASAPLSPR